MAGGYYVCGRCKAVTFHTIKTVKGLTLHTCRAEGCGHVVRIWGYSA